MIIEYNGVPDEVQVIWTSNQNTKKAIVDCSEKYGGSEVTSRTDTLTDVCQSTTHNRNAVDNQVGVPVTGVSGDASTVLQVDTIDDC